MILLIDNYDSFTYNLYQYVGAINPDVQVYRNDALSVDDVLRLHPSHVILSPGPGRPAEAGICENLLRTCQGHFPILGVCLGHQAIGEVFGGRVVLAPKLVHGKQSEISLSTDNELLQGLPATIKAARYHSLLVEKATLPAELKIIGLTAKEEVMALKHRKYKIFGLQFHPESIMTPEGNKIIQNFLHIQGGKDND